jgi:general secretion pathway protein D
MRPLGLMSIMLTVATLLAREGRAQDTVAATVPTDSVMLRFMNADLRSVIEALGRYLDRPLLVGNVPSVQVTFESRGREPRSEVRALLQGLAEAHGLALIADSAFYRIGPASEPATAPAQAGGAEGGGTIDLYVLRLKHARASDVAGTVGALFGLEGGGGGGGRTLSNGTLSDELQRDAGATTAPPSRAPPAGAARGDEQRGDATLHGAVTIVPDELTNALLIRASATDYDIVRAAVEQLDVRPLQVLIQVLIVEVRKDRLSSLGVDASAKGITFNNGRDSVAGSLAGGGLGTFVLQIMHMASFDFDAMLRMAVSRGDARIVSRPVLLASNNREARILVGSQRPFVQVSRSLPTDVPSRDQVIQYKDVGTKLTVIPTINDDGYVSLVIRQEVNNATNETQFDAPVISTREVETEVLVRDGQTIMLGGLREQQHEVTKGGVPLLSDVPIVGGLFGFEERRTTETELFLFITPMVLRDDAAADSAARRALGQAERAGVKLEERKP